MKKSILSLAGISSLFRRRKRLPRVENKISVSSGGYWDSPFSKSNVHTLANMELWQKCYIGDGMIFSLVNSIAQGVIESGWNIVSINKDAQKIVEAFIDRINFEELIFNAVVHLVVFGDTYIEKEFSSIDEEKLANLSLCDPKTIEIIVDKYGNEVSYQQIIDGQTIEEIDKDSIVHLKLYSSPSSPYGLSTLAANIDTIRRKIKMDEAIASSLIRHGFPRFHITVSGSEEGEVPPKETLEEIKNKFKDINEKNEFVTADLIKIQGIDTKGIENIEEYYNYYLALLLGGFQIPGEQLGLFTGSTEASGKVRERLFNRFLRRVQRQIARSFDLEVFPDILKDSFPEIKVKLRFEDISPIEESVKIKWVDPLLRTSDGPFEILSKDEIRKIFGYEPNE